MPASLDSLFETSVLEIVNITTETPAELTISQRIHFWTNQQERNVYIGRGSIFGNPYSHLAKSAAKWKVKTREEAVTRYREYLLSRTDLLERLSELQGKRLGCWCFPKLCHGMILVELMYNHGVKI